MSSEPPAGDLGVVVIALVGGAVLQACLQRLASHGERCLVMLGEDMGEAGAWRARFPDVEFADGRRMTVPMRRLRGLQAAQGELVALLEDTSLPEPGWIDGVRDAFSDDRVAAASGPVRLDPALGARDRALACAEYGRFHPGRYERLALGTADARGTLAVARLPGNNLAYRRAHILQILRDEPRGLVESEAHEILRSRGFRLAFQPRMAVRIVAADPRGARLGTRLRHGRLYAGLRAAGRGPARRVAGFAKALLLPAVLGARALAGMVHAVRPADWPATAIWILLMESAWAAGEGIGYLAGAGGSIEAWR